MHAALLVNSAWLDEERVTLSQLMVGLVDEQVRLTRVLPSRAVGCGPGQMSESLLCGQMTWGESKLGAMNQRRLVKLMGALDTAGVDLLHAFHGELWQPALVMGDHLEVPVICHVASMQEAGQAGRLTRFFTPGQSTFVATTGPIAAELRRVTENLVRIETIVPGVHVGDPALQERQPGETPSFAVCGDGLMDAAYGQLLEGIRQVVDARPETQFFFDGQRSDQRQVWRAVQSMGLLGNSTFTPQRLGRRDLLLMADAVVHPQALGRSRSVTLAAMGQGLPVLAAEDPALDYLIDGHTAWTLPQPTGAAWAELITRLIRDPHAATELGLRAPGVGRRRTPGERSGRAHPLAVPQRGGRAVGLRAMKLNYRDGRFTNAGRTRRLALANHGPSRVGAHHGGPARRTPGPHRPGPGMVGGSTNSSRCGRK